MLVPHTFSLLSSFMPTLSFFKLQLDNVPSSEGTPCQGNPWEYLSYLMKQRVAKLPKNWPEIWFFLYSRIPFYKQLCLRTWYNTYAYTLVLLYFISCQIRCCISEYCDPSLCLTGTLDLSLQACYPQPWRAQMCRHHLNKFSPKFHFFTLSSCTCGSYSHAKALCLTTHRQPYSKCKEDCFIP